MFSLKPKTYNLQACLRNSGRQAKKAFTLIEMAIVIAVIVLVSVVVYANYNEINDSGEVLAVGEAFRDNVHLVQNFAAGGKSVLGGMPNGWGINANRTTSKYTIFADLNNSKTYDYPVRVLLHGYDSASSPFNESSIFRRAVTFSSMSGSATGGMPSGNGYWDFNDSPQSLLVPKDSNGVTSSLDFVGNDFTIDTWFYLDVNNKGSLVSQPSSYKLYMSGSNKLMFDFMASTPVCDGITTCTVSSTAILSTATWYHTAAVRKGQFVMLFLNGQLQEIKNVMATTTMYNNNGAADTFIGQNGSAADYLDGRMSETRIVNGWANWTTNFSTTTMQAYNNDAEKYQQIKLNPGIVFQSLYNSAAAIATGNTTTLNLFFSPTDYNMYSDTVSGTSAFVILNKAGAKGTASTGDTPRAWRIWPSGLINSTSTTY